MSRRQERLSKTRSKRDGKQRADDLCHTTCSTTHVNAEDGGTYTERKTSNSETPETLPTTQDHSLSHKQHVSGDLKFSISYTSPVHKDGPQRHLSLTPMHNETVVERNETDQEKSKLIFLFHRLAELCARRPERAACPQANFDGCTVQRRRNKEHSAHVEAGGSHHAPWTLETPTTKRRHWRRRQTHVNTGAELVFAP